jgi:hypothetical protein
MVPLVEFTSLNIFLYWGVLINPGTSLLPIILASILNPFNSALKYLIEEYN